MLRGGGVERASGKTLSILVVEDDVATAELVRALLNDVPGWGATVVHDAAAARAVFRHVRIEVLVLDVNLPGITGLELLALLRRDPHWDEPPVVLMSADVDQPQVQTAIHGGEAVRFIAKPFDVDQLVEVIEQAVSPAACGPGRPILRRAEDRAHSEAASPAHPPVPERGPGRDG
jgi:CheY-like chemotaxis protein